MCHETSADLSQLPVRFWNGRIAIFWGKFLEATKTSVIFLFRFPLGARISVSPDPADQESTSAVRAGGSLKHPLDIDEDPQVFSADYTLCIGQFDTDSCLEVC